MSGSGPLLERLRAGGDVALPADTPGVPDAERVVAALETASAAGGADPEAAWRRLDEVAAAHDPETLDEVLARVARRGPLPFVGRGRRARLRDVARAALAGTDRPGTLRLAAALLGALGDDDDVSALETIGSHPAFTLHAATALADRGSQAAIAALLRLLTRTEGAERVIVMDRLLLFVRQPAVRLALVRDAFTDLDDVHAAEIAPVVVDALDVAGLARDPGAPDELRRSAARLLDIAGRSAPPHEVVD